jgi:hypothetical protein
MRKYRKRKSVHTELVRCRKLERPGPQPVRPNTGFMPEDTRRGKVPLIVGAQRTIDEQAVSIADRLGSETDEFLEAVSIDDGESSDVKRL